MGVNVSVSHSEHGIQDSWLHGNISPCQRGVTVFHKRRYTAWWKFSTDAGRQLMRQLDLPLGGEGMYRRVDGWDKVLIPRLEKETDGYMETSLRH